MACGCSPNKNAKLMVDTPTAYTPPAFRDVAAPGPELPGYVQARFLPEYGYPVINGRSYPLMLRNEIWWVHAQDVADRGNWWSLVDVPEYA